MRYKAFEESLAEIKAILTRNWFRHHARVADRLLSLARSDDPSFEEAVNSDEVWGGAGSLADVLFSDNVWWRRKASLREDDEEYIRALLKVADRMIDEGIASSRAREFARMVRLHRS